MALLQSRTRIIRSNPYAAPNRPLGFDPSHPASQGIGIGLGFSLTATASGGGLCLHTGQGVPATFGTPTSVIRYPGGLAVSLVNQSFGLGGQSSVEQDNVTVAGIFEFPTPTTANTFFKAQSAGTPASGWELRINASGIVGLYYAGNGSSGSFLTPALAANTLYFIAFSRTLTLINWVVVNLATGQTFSGSSTIATWTPPAAGNGFGASGSTAGPIFFYRGMYSPTLLSQAQLARWASDPWAFWHPHR